MGEVTIRRVAIHLTWKCTLRCEKCGAYIPQIYERGLCFDYDYNQIRQSLLTLFDLVDRIDVITLTGGEAILHKNIVDLCAFLLEHEEKFERLDFQTNGTILFSDKLLDVMAKSEKLTFFMDHYGPAISTKVEENIERCRQWGVKYQVRKYYGEDAHMNGWIDWSPRAEKISKEAAKEQFMKCANGRPDRRPFVIYGNLLTVCAMPYCRYSIGAQPLEDILQLDLADERLTVEEKRARLLEMRDADFNPGCQYCCGIGVDPDVKRYPAGKQVERA